MLSSLKQEWVAHLVHIYLRVGRGRLSLTMQVGNNVCRECMDQGVCRTVIGRCNLIQCRAALVTVGCTSLPVS